MARKTSEGGTSERSGSVAGMEDNLKKAVSEMLVLFLLSERDMYIGEIPEELEKRSNGTFHIVFPYSVIYRMVKFGYIEEMKKRIAPDGRRRQYYAITRTGRQYLEELRGMFDRFSEGISVILTSEGEEPAAPPCEVTPTVQQPEANETEEDERAYGGELSGCEA